MRMGASLETIAKTLPSLGEAVTVADIVF